MPISNIIPNAKALIAMRTDPDNRPELNRTNWRDAGTTERTGLSWRCGIHSEAMLRGYTFCRRFIQMGGFLYCAAPCMGWKVL